MEKKEVSEGVFYTSRGGDSSPVKSDNFPLTVYVYPDKRLVSVLKHYGFHDDIVFEKRYDNFIEGNNVRTTANNSIVVANNTDIEGDNNFIIGYNTKSDGDYNTIVAGTNPNIKQDSNYVIRGNNNKLFVGRFLTKLPSSTKDRLVFSVYGKSE